MRRLAVLGSPIEHSLSPLLQSTAYAMLGLDFEYGRAEVSSGGLRAFLGDLDESWLGLSLTMPLKREVVPLLASASPLVQQLGVANTVVLSRSPSGTDALEGWRLAGYNTDVDGITRAIRQTSTTRHEECTILGGGATAASALAAAAELEVQRVELVLRDVAKAGEASELAATLGVALTLTALAELDGTARREFVISTLPGRVSLPELLPRGVDALLLDVAYDPWPSPLATAWASRGGIAVSGLDMLVEQAIGQVRLFTGREQDSELPDESRIRAAMREAAGLPALPVVSGL